MKQRAYLLASTAASLPAVVGPVHVSAQTTAVSGNGRTGKVVTADSTLSSANNNILSANTSVGSTSTQTVYSGFNTVGGSGSGGGAGLGGVFFVDNGASLQLTNVSFANNAVTGGQGGGVKVDSAAPFAFSIAGTTADASAYLQYNPQVNASYDAASSSAQINSLTLPQQNSLVGVGSGIGVGMGGAYAATVGSTTLNSDGSQTLNLATPLTLAVGQGVDQVYQTPILGGNIFAFSDSGPVAIQSGMTIVGAGIPPGVVVDQITRASNGNIAAITAKYAGGGPYSLPVNAPFYVVNATSYDISRVAFPNDGSNLSNTLTSTGALAGFVAGQTVSGTGVPTGTTVTNVSTPVTDPVTGVTTTTITLSNQINLQTATDLKAVSNPIVSNTTAGGAVLVVASTTGLAVGQAVTGIGIPAGTTITGVSTGTNGNANVLTLSNPLSQGAVAAITNSSLIVSVNPVVSLSTGSVTLASVGGFSVGDAITGPPSANFSASSTAGSAVLTNVSSTAGLIVGQTIRKTDGTALGTIASIGTNSITLSAAIAATVTSGSYVAAAVPANAKITGIDVSTNTITYVIDPSIATANIGGSLDSLKAPGIVGTLGTDGRTGTNYAATFDNGEGAPGSNATGGGTGSNSAGGNGGNGGSGTNGSSTNKTLITTLALDTASLAVDFLNTGDDAAGVFTLPHVPGDIAAAVVDAAHVAFDTVQLTAWQLAEKEGLVALGGRAARAAMAATAPTSSAAAAVARAAMAAMARSRSRRCFRSAARPAMAAMAAPAASAPAAATGDLPAYPGSTAPTPGRTAMGRPARPGLAAARGRRADKAVRAAPATAARSSCAPAACCRSSATRSSRTTSRWRVRAATAVRRVRPPAAICS